MWPIVKWRLRRQESRRGEWSVLDPLRGYRICRYYHARHGGTHVYHPENGPAIGPVPLTKPQEAETVMRRYHEKHETFDLRKLEREIEQWRSESADA